MKEFFIDISTSSLEQIETPFYLYDLSILEETLLAIKQAVGESPFVIHYAIKANANSRVLEKVRSHDFGIDCVSGEEVDCALQHGFEPKKIAFAGVGKRDDEIELGIDQEIFTFNVESLEELKIIQEIAEKKGKKVDIALRFNPNVNAKTHEYITTGLEENKFGINFWELDELFELLPNLDQLNLIGIHFHIGSQIRDLSVYKNLCNRVNQFQKIFRERGYEIEHVNVGGGLGVDYEDPDQNLIPEFSEFFGIFKEFVDLYPGQSLHFELGRSIVAQSASLITKVLYVKKGIKTNFAIVDAGMTELIRPALYQAFHKIQNISKEEGVNEQAYDVVGPICESSDCFGKRINLPETERGDLLAIRTTGAYGEVMSSNYNLRKNAKAIYKDELD